MVLERKVDFLPTFHSESFCCFCDGGNTTNAYSFFLDGDSDDDGICNDVDTCDGDLDACGVCEGPGLNTAGCCGDETKDCAGNCGGSLQADSCGVCDADSANDCVQDCANVWGGNATEDCNSVCNGPGLVNTDGDGECCASGSIDSCDVCDGDGTSCVVGCMDSTACNFNPNAGVAGDCSYTDNCGICGGLDAGVDCAGLCSGSLSDGTWTNANPGTSATTLAASGTDWTLAECGMSSSVDTPIVVDGVSLLSIAAVYGPCDYTSSVFSGTVNVYTQTTHFPDLSFATSVATFTVDGGTMFNFTTTSQVTGEDNGSVIGVVSGGSLAGASNQTYYEDVDGDGLGDANSSATYCSSNVASGWVLDSSDTDDACASDEYQNWYADSDGDGLGFGDATSVDLCTDTTEVTGSATNNSDTQPDCVTNDEDTCGFCGGGEQKD